MDRTRAWDDPTRSTPARILARAAGDRESRRRGPQTGRLPEWSDAIGPIRDKTALGKPSRLRLSLPLPLKLKLQAPKYFRLKANVWRQKKSPFPRRLRNAQTVSRVTDLCD